MESLRKLHFVWRSTEMKMDWGETWSQKWGDDRKNGSQGKDERRMEDRKNEMDKGMDGKMEWKGWRKGMEWWREEGMEWNGRMRQFDLSPILRAATDKHNFRQITSISTWKYIIGFKFSTRRCIIDTLAANAKWFNVYRAAFRFIFAT